MASLRTLAPLALVVTLVGCASNADGPRPFGMADDGAAIESIEPELTASEGTTPETSEYLHLVTPDLAACPAGARFDEVGGFCVAGSQALGPFPAGMVAECQRLGGGAQCATARWELDLARRARGEALCPAGTDVDLETGLCADDRYVYGPFDVTLIKECRLTGGGAQCDELRWDKWFAPLLSADDVKTTEGGATFQRVPTRLDEACGPNARLFNYYKSQSGFMTVRRASRAKLREIGAATANRPDRNGCATYLSYALRQSGALPGMPIEPGTEGFRDALLRRGWRVIRDPAQFQAGDVIVTRDRAGVPGHPDHVYMYAGSKDGAPGMGYVIDNQGTLVHERNISARGSKTRAAYALRAPNSRSGSCDENNSGGDAIESEDSCAGKSDGWYCSDLRAFSAYQCVGAQIKIGYQCAQGQTCSRVGAQPDDRAQMNGTVPACGSQASAPASGQTCKSDGQCNPGQDGAGKICSSGQCVAGCRADYHCPGATTCRAGQCGGAPVGTGAGGGGAGGGGASAPGNSAAQAFSAKGTGYFPSSSKLEGGFKDRLGNPLYTLQDFLAGKAPYVSVAMDPKAFAYGTKLRIDELERKFGKVIEFRVVDTGGAFFGKGTGRIDVCVANAAATVEAALNGTLSIRVVK